MKNTTGPPVTGENFFDRVHEQRRIWRALQENNILLLAPRRVGKTSLLLRLRDTADTHQFHSVYISVSDVTHEFAFVQRLFNALHKLGKVGGILEYLKKSPVGRFLKKVKKVGAAGFSVELDRNGENYWDEIGIILADSLQKLKGTWLIEIDELPLFILKLMADEEHPGRAGKFLYWLRGLRQESPHLRWILAGSIGLDNVVARVGLGDTINDLRLMDLGAFDNKTAHDFLDKLGESHDLALEKSVRDDIIRGVGWPMPYYLQVVFSELRDYCEDIGQQPEKSAVARVFDNLLAPTKKAYFDYWRQRLHKELGSPDDQFAILLLNAICKTEQGLGHKDLHPLLATKIAEPGQCEEKLHYLADCLESDGYLVLEAGRFRFRLNLLRTYWRRRVAHE